MKSIANIFKHQDGSSLISKTRWRRWWAESIPGKPPHQWKLAWLQTLFLSPFWETPNSKPFLKESPHQLHLPIQPQKLLKNISSRKYLSPQSLPLLTSCSKTRKIPLVFSLSSSQALPSSQSLTAIWKPARKTLSSSLPLSARKLLCFFFSPTALHPSSSNLSPQNLCSLPNRKDTSSQKNPSWQPDHHPCSWPATQNIS